VRFLAAILEVIIPSAGQIRTAYGAIGVCGFRGLMPDEAVS
jgi:hypothetical protein